ncbi:hypothetical protein M8J76_016684 [Diaphorina citri]|nr:hypothetical protein M8J76_016684 [Diaphorina citri]
MSKTIKNSAKPNSGLAADLWHHDTQLLHKSARAPVRTKLLRFRNAFLNNTDINGSAGVGEKIEGTAKDRQELVKRLKELARMGEKI